MKSLSKNLITIALLMLFGCSERSEKQQPLPISSTPKPLETEVGERPHQPGIVSPVQVQAVASAVVSGMKKEGLLIWKRYSGEYKGCQAVLIKGGVRYTVYISNESGKPDQSGLDWISIWARPDGTYSNDHLVTWTDNAFDGEVDWGWVHDGNPEFKSSKISHQHFYQKKHNRAIEDLYDFYN